MKRGYCGIGVQNLKKDINYGTLFRSALNLDADFIFLIGKRFEKQASDTVKAYRHMPLFEYPTAADFISHIPYDCIPVAVEIINGARDLIDFIHPERAVYILGPEDGSVTPELLDRCSLCIKIPTTQCLNVSVAGAIILYDRLLKRSRR